MTIKKAFLINRSEDFKRSLKLKQHKEREKIV